MATEDIRLCEQTTQHAHLGNTGSCLCGERKYSVKKEGPTIYHCPSCGEQPEVAKPGPLTDGYQYNGESQEQPPPLEVFCATEGCIAFSNVVTLERWNKRAPHEQEVAHIPSTEPIFVLRAQDALGLVPVWKWVELADMKNIPGDKVQSAVNRANEMQKFQDTNGNKMPD